MRKNINPNQISLMTLYGAIDDGYGWTYGNDPEQNNEQLVREAACIVKRICGPKRQAATGEWR